MNKNFSIYLDFVRFIAAIIVLLHHFSDILFSSNIRIFNIGHEAVVIFFVLSGYVVAYSDEIKNHSMSEYFIARFSRIYSVALPAVVLTLLLDLIGSAFCRDCYQDIYFAIDYPIIRFLASLTFSGELWFVSIMSFSNIPYWSIHYEMFFYVFFGFLTYANPKYRIPLLVLVSLIAGPKILIMLPLWLFGVWLYKHKHNVKNTKALLCIWTLTTCGLLYLLQIDAKNGLTNVINPTFVELTGLNFNMGGSRFFVFDYLFGIVFGLNLVVSKELCGLIKTNLEELKSGKITRYLANRTFSIYLFHFPLLGFYNVFVPQGIETITRSSIILTLTLISIFILSRYTEQKKHVYSKFLRQLSTKLSHKFAFIAEKKA